MEREVEEKMKEEEEGEDRREVSGVSEVNKRVMIKEEEHKGSKEAKK